MLVLLGVGRVPICVCNNINTISPSIITSIIIIIINIINIINITIIINFIRDDTIDSMRLRRGATLR